MQRKFPRKLRTIVIKVGSSLIATKDLKPNLDKLKSLVDQICRQEKEKVNVVLVSSGAIALGLGELNKKTRAIDLSYLQAAAAIGQTVLMRIYSDLFKKNKSKCAQILLTWDDFNNRSQYNNARKTIQALFLNGIVPIINENDTVSTDEIRKGDNDKLSALVASMIQADLLILLTDVEGVYQDAERKQGIIDEVKELKDVQDLVKGTAQKLLSKGGMHSKIDAVHVASHAKIPSIIASGHTKNVIDRIMAGERIGTFFVEKDDKMLNRKHWISFGAHVKGAVRIDDGAEKAVLKGGVSLLLPGIVAWEGQFKKGEVVAVCDTKGNEIARGVTNYSHHMLEAITEKKGAKEFIHCDSLVLSKR